MTLTRTSIDVAEVPTIVSRWLLIGYPDKRPTEADATHSALLQRLLAGREPLSEPPPRAFSYPWYDLIDNGTSSGYMDVNFDGDDAVYICQARWELIANPDAGEFIVEWAATKLRCHLQAAVGYGGSTMTVIPQDDVETTGKERNG